MVCRGGAAQTGNVRSPGVRNRCNRHEAQLNPSLPDSRTSNVRGRQTGRGAALDQQGREIQGSTMGSDCGHASLHGRGCRAGVRWWQGCRWTQWWPFGAWVLPRLRVRLCSWRCRGMGRCHIPGTCPPSRSSAHTSLLCTSGRFMFQGKPPCLLRSASTYPRVDLCTSPACLRARQGAAQVGMVPTGTQRWALPIASSRIPGVGGWACGRLEIVSLRAHRCRTPHSGRHFQHHQHAVREAAMGRWRARPEM